jgi:putative peptide zinc metalloprotease protein
MTDSVFSPSWYRVAGLQPRLRSHAEIHRHHYRGQRWYVLQDRLSGRQHRFTPAAHYVIGLMDGKRVFHKIWETATEHLGDDAPTQDELIRLLGQLHASDLLLCDVPPDSLELFQRYQKHQRSKWKQRLLSPLSIKIPLWDPESFLARWEFVANLMFSWFGGIVWSMVVGGALVAAASHWTDLTMNITDLVLAPNNLLMLFVVYPIIKLLHELGHAFATKRWGGEVHELGIMLLVFMPVPYVDASAASAFRDKKRRMIVGAAGMMVELFLAAIALFVWLSVEPGWVRSIAFNVMLIGSVSTLFFNANPLLRFDGYFIFSDLIETPNLGARSTQYLAYAVQRYLFGITQAQSPAQSNGERVWFSIYGVAAFCYRCLIVGAIILFVAEKFFFVGIVLAVWGVGTMIAFPLAKSANFLLTSPVIQRKRVRAVTTTAIILTISVGFLALVPMPLDTRVEGVVWLPEKSYVRANVDGFTRRILKSPNTYVKQGEPLFETEDPVLTVRRNILELRLRELAAQYDAQWVSDIGKSQIVKEAMTAVRADLKSANQDVENMTIRSPSDGLFVVPRAEDLLQGWLKHGQLVAYVIQYPVTTIRAVVTQDRIGLVRGHTRKVEIRPIGDRGDRHAAVIQREVPAASSDLPSMALGKGGGGEIATHPDDGHGTKAFETMFQFDLKIVDQHNLKNIGSRVLVRFDHGKEPLASQWFRQARQLLLRRYGV